MFFQAVLLAVFSQPMVPYDFPHPALNLRRAAVKEPHPPPLASDGASLLSQNSGVVGWEAATMVA